MQIYYPDKKFQEKILNYFTKEIIWTSSKLQISQILLYHKEII